MPLVSEKTPTWQRVVAMVLLVAVFVFVLVTFLKLGSNTDAVNATRDSVERTDCARRVNAEQSKARDAATLADRSAARADRAAANYFYGALLSGERATAAQYQEFGSLVSTAKDLTAQAEAADKVLAELPDPAAEVDRRCPG